MYCIFVCRRILYSYTNMSGSSSVVSALTASSPSSSVVSPYAQSMLSHTAFPIDIVKLIGSYISMNVYRFGGEDADCNIQLTSLMMSINTFDNNKNIQWISLPDMRTTRRSASACMIDN